ncbi:MAG: host attachment protein, partial [Porphyrobacter sp.]|nr:host attachment protein [Porphyrobacter sp.]
MILPHKLVVMVVDGGRMVLMRNDGDATHPQLTVIAHRDCPAPPNRDVFADAPGRTFASHGENSGARLGLEAGTIDFDGPRVG